MKYYVILWLLSLLFQPAPRMNITRLKPVSKDFFEFLAYSQDGSKRNIPLGVTYAQHGWYRQDWRQPSAAPLEYPYIWNSPSGPRIRFMTGLPVVLDGCRIGLDAAMNADNTVPDTDPCYWYWHEKWFERPAIDLEDLLQDPTLRALWVKFLEKHGHTRSHRKFGVELEALGFDKTTGLPRALRGNTMNLTLYENLPVVEPLPHVPIPEPVPDDLRLDTPDDPSWLPPVLILVAATVLSLIAARKRVKVYARVG